jgi:uncharacterized protein
MDLFERIGENTFWLTPQRCIYWEEEKALIVADLHFGKTGHFRKAGIAVPQNVFKEDLQRLFAAIQFYKPVQLLIVGDLFHSKANKELELFLKWRQDIAHVNIILIKGNHDILKDEWYQQAGINVHHETLSISGFCFTHDIVSSACPDPDLKYFFTGHIHPGIQIHGLGRQTLSFPCFYFTGNYAVLPAFSHFTGMYMVKPQPGEKAYAVVNQSVIAL